MAAANDGSEQRIREVEVIRTIRAEDFGDVNLSSLLNVSMLVGLVLLSVSGLANRSPLRSVADHTQSPRVAFTAASAAIAAMPPDIMPRPSELATAPGNCRVCRRSDPLHPVRAPRPRRRAVALRSMSVARRAITRGSPVGASAALDATSDGPSAYANVSSASSPDY